MLLIFIFLLRFHSNDELLKQMESLVVVWSLNAVCLVNFAIDAQRFWHKRRHISFTPSTRRTYVRSFVFFYMFILLNIPASNYFVAVCLLSDFSKQQQPLKRTCTCQCQFVAQKKSKKKKKNYWPRKNNLHLPYSVTDWWQTYCQSPPLLVRTA